MGVRGLLSYVLRHADAMSQRVDLAQEAQYYGRNGVTLLVDVLDFCAWFLPEVDRAAKGWESDSTFQVYGSDFAQHDEALCELIFALRHAGKGLGIYLEFFMDPPRGCGLLDAATSAWTEEAKRRCSQGLEAAKAVRQWCRGERNDLPNITEAAEFVIGAERGALRRFSTSRNVLWDPEGVAQSGHMFGALYRTTSIGRYAKECFSVAYTSSDVIAEYLRLGHPPKEEDLKAPCRVSAPG
ncbi:spop [Symbiodinium pilosum]|uniref:Spop protein n=1 Tax=Symbiodinium pilosum TaxID=2952 RepID=A0A812K6G3_SYMPI|nr:spop [Symbiodinium pilosum]